MSITSVRRFLPLSLLLFGACAQGSRVARQQGSGEPYVSLGAGDAERCRPDGALVVHNGEAFGVELVSLPANNTPWSMGRTLGQRLGPLAAGATDTLVDVRTDLRIVLAQASATHASYRNNEVNGFPTNPVQKVRFTCTRAQGN